MLFAKKKHNIKMKSQKFIIRITEICSLLKCSLCLLADCCECFLIGNCKLSEHLTVEIDTSNLKTVHKGGIVHSVYLCLCGNSGDPERTEISLFLFTACESIVAALHNGLFSHLEVFALCAPVTFCEFEECRN